MRGVSDAREKEKSEEGRKERADISQFLRNRSNLLERRVCVRSCTVSSKSMSVSSKEEEIGDNTEGIKLWE